MRGFRHFLCTWSDRPGLAPDSAPTAVHAQPHGVLVAGRSRLGIRQLHRDVCAAGDWPITALPWNIQSGSAAAVGFPRRRAIDARYGLLMAPKNGCERVRYATQMTRKEYYQLRRLADPAHIWLGEGCVCDDTMDTWRHRTVRQSPRGGAVEETRGRNHTRSIDNLDA